MKPEDIYYTSLASVVCGLLGTVLLAFSLSLWMRAISCSLNALEAFKDTFLAGKPVLNVINMDTHRLSGAKRSQLSTYGGLFMIVIASILQVILLYYASTPKL